MRYYVHLWPADEASRETLAGDDGTTVLVGVRWEAGVEVTPGDDMDFFAPAMTVRDLGIVPGNCGSGNGDPDWTELEDVLNALGFETRPAWYSDPVTREVWLEAYRVMRPLGSVAQPTWQALLHRRYAQRGGAPEVPWFYVVQVVVEHYGHSSRVSVAAVLREAARRAQRGAASTG